MENTATASAQEIEVHGRTYQVEMVGNDLAILKGPRSANFGLLPIRDKQNKPTGRMYAFNMRTGSRRERCLDLYFFTIEDGRVTAHPNW